MNYRVLIPLFSMGVFALTGCIADEPANAECDIEQCWIHLDAPEAVFYHSYDTLAGIPVSTDQPDVKVIPTTADSIVFTTRWNAVVEHSVPLFFRVTPNAQVFHLVDGREVPFVSGTPVDLRATGVGRYTPQTFIVRSEDGKWQRSYRVSIQVPPMPSYPPEGFEFKFDSYGLDSKGKYYVWTEANPFLPDVQWANGNPGFAISKSSALSDAYPTVPEAHGGFDGGPCLKLTTQNTGGFGKMVNMLIAPGSHFIGTFDVGPALKGQAGALAATRFGIPFPHKPLVLRGYYKYLPGAFKQDRSGQRIDGAVDYPDIYSVFYRNVDADGNEVQLDGADVLTNPHIVAVGRLRSEDVDATGQEWRRFEIPLVYTGEVSDDDIREKKYSFTISFTSSIDGAYFEGAVGSTLWIDDVTLECAF